MHRKIIDITEGISPETPVYPGDPETVIESVASVDFEGYAVSRVTFGTHTGTHVDAPAHIFEGGSHVEKIPIESLMGLALLLDLSFVSADISAEDLDLALESFNGDADDACILLIRTGSSCDSEDRSSPADPIFLGSDAGSWIVDHGFRTVGIDTLSVDIAPSLENHRLFLENGINIVENLNLCEAESGLYSFICLPLKLHGCEAAPARAILLDKAYFA